MKKILYRLFHFCLIAFTVLAGLVVVLSFMGSMWWGFDLLSHFRVQYLIGLSLFLVILLTLRKKYQFVSLALVFLLNFVQIFPFYLPNVPTARAGDRHNNTEIFFANVYYQVENIGPLADEITAENPDLVVFAELNAPAFETLKTQMSDYPYTYFVESYHAFDLSVISKKPLHNIQSIYFGQQTQSPTLIFSIDQNGRQIKIVGVHTHTPVKKEMKVDRDAELAGIANYVSLSSLPVVVLGDFNSTAWSSGYSVLLKYGGLSDTQIHQGVQASWPAYLPAVMRIPIDQALISADIKVVDRRIGDDVGSDHLPVILNIEW